MGTLHLLQQDKYETYEQVNQVLFVELSLGDYSLASMIPPVEIANVASLSGMSGL